MMVSNGARAVLTFLCYYVARPIATDRGPDIFNGLRDDLDQIPRNLLSIRPQYPVAGCEVQ